MKFIAATTLLLLSITSFASQVKETTVTSKVIIKTAKTAEKEFIEKIQSAAKKDASVEAKRVCMKTANAGQYRLFEVLERDLVSIQCTEISKVDTGCKIKTKVKFECI